VGAQEISLAAAGGASAVAACVSARIAIAMRTGADAQVQASADAARAAETAARAAETLTRIETARRHDELDPRPEFAWSVEPDMRGGSDNLWLSISSSALSRQVQPERADLGLPSAEVGGQVRWPGCFLFRPVRVRGRGG
jgi:hypothetical protein